VGVRRGWREREINGAEKNREEAQKRGELSTFITNDIPIKGEVSEDLSSLIIRGIGEK